jgi:hypothetical protein
VPTLDDKVTSSFDSVGSKTHAVTTTVVYNGSDRAGLTTPPASSTNAPHHRAFPTHRVLALFVVRLCSLIVIFKRTLSHSLCAPRTSVSHIGYFRRWILADEFVSNQYLVNSRFRRLNRAQDLMTRALILRSYPVYRLSRAYTDSEATRHSHATGVALQCSREVPPYPFGPYEGRHLLCDAVRLSSGAWSCSPVRNMRRRCPTVRGAVVEAERVLAPIRAED